MATSSDMALRRALIYQVYVRNHTPEGTFRALEGDLPRIRALGTDIVYLMPIHPVGVAGKKGTLGCPYAIRDYRAANPEYGTLVCRCEQVTEAEIRAAIRRPVGARTIDAVKRRTRAGMGRCQGGFCSPRVLEILSEELHIDPTQVTKCGGESRLLVGTIAQAAGKERDE